jgi:hypothetical protein
MAAHSSPWHLDGFNARLALDQWTGQIDLRNPASGMSLSAGTAERLAILGVDLPAVDPAVAAKEIDCYVRGGDLVATYHETHTRKRRGQVYWRIVNLAKSPQQCAIELVASVQTSLLDSDPTVEIHSTFQADEALQLTDPIAERAVPLSLATQSSCDTMPACFIFRLRGAPLSYIEMVHPLDFVESRLTPLPDGAMRWTTSLFQGRLEKGVILRSRLKALIAPRNLDVASAALCYRDFAASEPPLTV